MEVERLGSDAPHGTRIVKPENADRGRRAGEPWQFLAACGLEKVDPEIFEHDLAAAAAVCGRCAVLEACLDDALRLRAVDIYRAGLTSSQLMALSHNNKYNRPNQQQAG